MIESNGMKVGGLLTFWTLPRHVRLAELRQGLDALGLGKHAPDARTPSAALRTALEEVFPSKSYRVEPLKSREAFEIIEVLRGERQNVYRHAWRVCIDEQKAVDLQPFDDNMAESIVWEFNKHLGLVTGPAVTQGLVGILSGMQGTRLRQNGGLYWLADTHRSQWREVADMVEGVPGTGGRSAVYQIHHQMDHDAIRAVRDAICKQVAEDTQEIHDAVLSGELGARALAHKQKQAKDLFGMITLYEEILGGGLGDLRRDLEKTEESVSAATLLISAGAGAGV